MTPSADIKTLRSGERSLDEAGPPSPIDIDTPEEDQEREEKKKQKKKKKKKREEGQDVSQHVQMDVNKEKTKRKRRMEDGGSEELEEDVSQKKKKKKIKKLGEEMVEEVMVKEGGEEEQKKKKKKEKNNLEEQTIVVKEGGKKKKKNNLGEETIEGVVGQGVVNGGKEKKKKKRKIEEIMVVEENAVNEGLEKKKKKKKVTEETIEGVEENRVTVNEGGEKKKKKKKVAEETTEGPEENRVNEGVEEKKKKKGVNLEERGGGGEVPESRAGVVELNGRKKTGTTQEAKKKKRVISDGLADNLFDFPEAREILELYPNIKSRVVMARTIRYDLHRFREFKKQGISLRLGRCTVAEKKLIRENVNDFLALTGISSAQELFYPPKSQFKHIKNLRIQHGFMEKIAEGLHRPCFLVYNVAKKMTNELNHKGRFDEDEVNMLQRLHTRHGNNWREIAKSMDRSVEALQKRYAHIASQHGLWDSDEMGKLNQAMRAHLETLVGPDQTGSASKGPWLTSGQLCKNLPWKSISEKVGTRCWSQCREKWFTLLKSKMASDDCPAFSGGVKAVQAKVKLINELYNMDVEDPALIDWDEVAITIGEVSHHYVQKAFYRLKVSAVPRWSELSYPEIIDFLEEKVRPKLEEHLREVGEADLPREEKYYLSHIFAT